MKNAGVRYREVYRRLTDGIVIYACETEEVPGRFRKGLETERQVCCGEEEDLLEMAAEQLEILWRDQDV